MGRIRVVLALVVALVVVAANQTTTPIVHYLDCLSGPTSGGENNLGAYLSVFGENFGNKNGLGTTTKVFVGGVEVANYRYLGPSKVYDRMNIQQITVQVGALAGLVPGTSYPVTVSVNGQVSTGTGDFRFTPNPGRIWFVSLTGNDATAAANDITKPYRHLQLPSGSTTGVFKVIQAGDHVVIRGGSWTDIGFQTSWARFQTPQQRGYPPTGQAGSGWIHFTAYPGPIKGNAIEVVHYHTTPGNKGGFQGADDDYKYTTGGYCSFSNLEFDMDKDASSDAAPFNMQYGFLPWRVVNNEMGPWPATTNKKAGGVSGGGQNCSVYGNYIHDISGDVSLENHGVYVDWGGLGWDLAYNWITGITKGNGIQLFGYNGADNTWPGFINMSIHHNWIQNIGRFGINLADTSRQVNVWNNVVTGASYAAIRHNANYVLVQMVIAFNTLYNNNLIQTNPQGQIQNTWQNTVSGSYVLYINNIIAAGPGSYAGNNPSYFASNSNPFPVIFRNNLYFDAGLNYPLLTQDAQGIYGNPMFSNKTVKGFDPYLKAGSPAIDKATSTFPAGITPLLPLDDFTRVVARPQGPARDIGALERIVNV